MAQPGKSKPSTLRQSGRTVSLTREGFERLKAELEHLRTAGRTEVAERIREAKSHGDITESAQYEAAKNDQAFLEGRIRTLEMQLNNASIITPGENSGMITIGATVVVRDKGGNERRFTIVDPAEASSGNGRISMNAPVGRALVGRSIGDTVTVEAPSGSIEFTILTVE